MGRNLQKMMLHSLLRGRTIIDGELKDTSNVFKYKITKAIDGMAKKVTLSLTKEQELQLMNDLRVDIFMQQFLYGVPEQKWKWHPLRNTMLEIAKENINAKCLGRKWWAEYTQCKDNQDFLDSFENFCKGVQTMKKQRFEFKEDKLHPNHPLSDAVVFFDHDVERKFNSMQKELQSSDEVLIKDEMDSGMDEGSDFDDCIGTYMNIGAISMQKSKNDGEVPEGQLDGYESHYLFIGAKVNTL